MGHLLENSLEFTILTNGVRGTSNVHAQPPSGTRSLALYNFNNNNFISRGYIYLARVPI